MNELYLIKSGDNGFVEETSAVISADSGEISINDSLYVESAGNIGIGSSNPVNKLDVVGSASISSDLTVQGITFTNVGGNSPSAANDIIMYNGSDWVVAAASQLPGGGGGGAGNSAVPAGLINTLTQGDAIHEVTFGYDASGARIVYDNVPKIAASLEIDGAGEIIPHTVSGVSESGYFVVFSEELPTANYRMHTVFGGTDAFWETGVANLEYSDRNVEVTRSLYVGQKVGIGTTSPGVKLDIHDTNDPVIALKNSSTNALAQISLIDKGSTNGAIAFQPRALGGGPETAMTINYNGNVGIGTTSPAAKLEVNLSNGTYISAKESAVNQVCGYIINANGGAQTAIFSSDTSTGEVRLGGTATNYYQTFYTSNSERMRIDSSGNVGIGATNPSAALDIRRPNTATNTPAIMMGKDPRNSHGNMIIQGQNIGVHYDEAGLSTVPAGASRIVLGNGSFEIERSASTDVGNARTWETRLKILDNGNVGIGTTNPADKLDVQGGYSFLNTLRINGAADTATIWKANGDMTIYPQTGSLHLGGAGTSQLMTLTSSNVGIGTTNPGAILDVEDSDLSGYIFKARDSGGTRFVVVSGGNVGIGTTNPLDILHVSPQGVTNSNFRVDGGNGLIHLKAVDDASTANVDLAMGPAANTIYIKNDGNVAIGTTATVVGSTSYKLFVNGRMFVESTVVLNSLSASSDVQTNAAKQLISTSDKRLKNDLGDCEYGLNEVLQVQPKKYTWKEGPEDQKPTVGFFAQDVHLIMPEAAPREAIQNENGEDDYKWGFHSQTIIAALVNATKEQQTMIEDLKKEIEQLKS